MPTSSHELLLRHHVCLELLLLGHHGEHLLLLHHHHLLRLLLLVTHRVRHELRLSRLLLGQRRIQRVHVKRVGGGLPRHGSRGRRLLLHRRSLLLRCRRGYAVEVEDVDLFGGD